MYSRDGKIKGKQSRAVAARIKRSKDGGARVGFVDNRGLSTANFSNKNATVFQCEEEFPADSLRGGQAIDNSLIKAAAQAGIEHATKMAHRAYQQAMIVKNNDDARAAYVKWFGAYDNSPESIARWKLVTVTINKIIAGLSSAVNFYWAKPSEDKGGLWAYVYPDKPGNIFLGQMFKKKYETKDAKEGVGGTIIHEISHYVNGTEDHKYGDECLALAVNVPEDAVRNADSYLFFAEEFMDTRWER